jgi:hypothetical protein
MKEFNSITTRARQAIDRFNLELSSEREMAN